MSTNPRQQIKVGDTAIAIQTTGAHIETEKSPEYLGRHPFRIVSQGTTDAAHNTPAFAANRQGSINQRRRPLTGVRSEAAFA